MKKFLLIISLFFFFSYFLGSKTYAVSCHNGEGTCGAICGTTEEDLGIDPGCGHVGIHCCLPQGGGGGYSGGIDFSVIKVPGFNANFVNIGAIVSAILPWVFGLAGIILLVMLILGGFQLMMSAGDPKAAASAKGKLTGALIGFLIIFCAYWITQIMEKILGLNTGLF